jgi:hypothetical protein
MSAVEVAMVAVVVAVVAMMAQQVVGLVMTTVSSALVRY